MLHADKYRSKLNFAARRTGATRRKNNIKGWNPASYADHYNIYGYACDEINSLLGPYIRYLSCYNIFTFRTQL